MKALIQKTYEVIAAALLGAGAVLLVAVYLPVINPVLFGRMDGDDLVNRALTLVPGPRPLMRYLLGTLLSLLLLCVAWLVNLKAQGPQIRSPE